MPEWNSEEVAMKWILMLAVATWSAAYAKQDDLVEMARANPLPNWILYLYKNDCPFPHHEDGRKYRYAVSRHPSNGFPGNVSSEEQCWVQHRESSEHIQVCYKMMSGELQSPDSCQVVRKGLFISPPSPRERPAF